MEPLTFRQWIALAAIVTLALIPIIWYYWKIWDRPSRAAERERSRRRRETEMREMFQREELKLRTEEAKQAKLAMMRRKAQAPETVPNEVLRAAFRDLSAEPLDPAKGGVMARSGSDSGGVSGSDGGEVEVGSEVADIAMTDELEAVDVPRIREMLDDLPDVDFDEEEVHDGPIAVRLNGRPGAGAATRGSLGSSGGSESDAGNGAEASPDDAPPPAPDLSPWHDTDW